MHQHHSQTPTTKPTKQHTHTQVSTATTALGEHLTTGTLYGAGMHGTTPSNTSRYASTDIGLIHMVRVRRQCSLAQY